MSVALPYNRTPMARPCKGDELPCAVCNRPITKASQARCAWVHIHGGGSIVVTHEEASTLDGAADLGGHPIGNDCLKKHPELQPYAVRNVTVPK